MANFKRRKIKRRKYYVKISTSFQELEQIKIQRRMKMKKFLVLLVVLLTVVSLAACGGGKNEIPNVFGIDYNDAISVLEAEGYEVKAIATSVGSIAEKLLYPLEKVDEGIVIKIDDYVLDNNGNLTNNYDILYGDKAKMDSVDKSIVIYYAKEDYLIEKENSETTPIGDGSTDIEEPDNTEKVPENDSSAETGNDDIDISDGLDAEFKAAMDDYEKFMDEYVAFMKKYKKNPSDLGLLADYANFMSKYADFVEDFEKWEDAEMNAAETAYYIEVQSRVSKKLLEVAY